MFYRQRLRIKLTLGQHSRNVGFKQPILASFRLYALRNFITTTQYKRVC